MKISFIEDFEEHIAGEEIDLPTDEAQRIINTGYAFPVNASVVKAPKSNITKPAAKKPVKKGATK